MQGVRTIRVRGYKVHNMVSIDALSLVSGSTTDLHAPKVAA